MTTNFNQLIDEVKSSGRRVITVAVAQDLDVLEALQKAYREKLADAILVGNKSIIENTAKRHKVKISHFSIVDIHDEKEAVLKAIQLIHEGNANVLMKGFFRIIVFSFILHMYKNFSITRF